MRVARKAVVKRPHVLMKHCVFFYRVGEILKLFTSREFAVDEQIAGLEKVAMLGQLLDGVTSVSQNAGIAIQISDRAGR